MATTPSPNDPSFWDDISQMLGKSAAGAGSGRAAEATYLSARDRTAAELYNIAQTARTQAAGQDITRSAAALNADKFRTSLPGQGASEAVRGAMIQNAQPVTLDLGKSHITPIAFGGGSGVANFTPETRAAGAALAAHGTSLLNNPDSFATGAMPSAATTGASQFIAPPSLSAMPPASFWEQAAGAGSIASGLMSALAKAAAGGNSSAANALKKLLGGGGGGSGNPFGGDTGVAGTPGGPLSSWDPTQQTDVNGNPIPGVNLGDIGQGPVSGIDTSMQNPEDPNTANPDWWNQLPDSGE